MESKKTFGEYICKRRKELGLTQREFADKLYVTESAVSKWERGMSYPDVTLLRDICAVLDVSEHELLTASVDTEKRTAERLAAKYLRLARSYRVAQYILYGAILAGCGVSTIINGYGLLGWFPIALAGVLLAASLTLVPALASRRPSLEPYKWAVSTGCAVASLELLLLFCCLFSGGDWFPVALAATLFGLSLVLLPFLLPMLPLPAAFNGRKTSLYLGAETVLLLLLLLVCCLYTGGTWFPVAAAGVVFGLSLFFTPVFLRQLPLPQALAERKFSLYLGIETALLLVLLLVCCLYNGGSWFAVAAVAILFGLGILFFPVVLRQLPLPENVGRHKALVYFSIETVLLLVLLAVSCWYGGGDWFLTQGVPQALLGLALPWGLMLILRYLPVGGWFRASASCAWTGLWLWLYPWFEDRIMMCNGWTTDHPYSLLVPYDFSNWGPYVVQADDGVHVYYSGVANNVQVIILLSLGVLAAALAVVGAVRKTRRSR